MHFSAVPVELVEHICSFLDPEDLPRLNLTNKALHTLLEDSQDSHLWRTIFLSRFDHPKYAVRQIAREQPTHMDTRNDKFVYNWRTSLKRRIRATKIMPAFLRVSSADRIFAMRCLCDIVLSAEPYSLEATHSKSAQYVQDLLEQFPLPGYDKWPHPTGEELELKAWLRANAAAAPIEPDVRNVDFDRLTARAMLYDLRNYPSGSAFGPFGAGMSISWVYVDAIILLVLHAVKIDMDALDVYPPSSFQSSRRFSSRNFDRRPAHDWAGVNGVWTRLVCFCDYRDLINYNRSAIGDDESLDTSIFKRVDFKEAIRVIRVEMKVKSTSDNPENSKYPILHVIGKSSQIGGSETYGRLEGDVWMTSNGVVRWQFNTNIGSSPNWHSEAVQVGGVGSAIGIAGLWSGIDRTAEDPVGPFLLWKVSGPETSLDNEQ